MHRIIWFSAVFCFFLVESIAQERRKNDLKGILYNTEKALDLKIMTQGWAADAYFGRLRTYYKTRYYTFGIGSLRHPKEKRSVTQYVANGFSTGFRHYIYGKQNYLYTLHGGVGMKRYYTEKAEKKGVSLAINYAAGFMAGLVVPYYLDVTDPSKRGTAELIKYTQETATLFLNPRLVRGKGGIFKGFPEASVVPGIYAKTGVHLDWGTSNKFLTAVEAGVQLQIFAKKIPLLITEENRPYFFNLYASLQFGKRN